MSMSTTPSAHASGIGTKIHEQLEKTLADIGIPKEDFEWQEMPADQGHSPVWSIEHERGKMIQGREREHLIGLDKDARALQELIDRITYKKGWKLEVVPMSLNGFTALKIITPPLQDTYHPDDPTRVAPVQFMFPCYMMFSEMAEAAQIAFVDRCLQDAEIHEQQEWFRIDGKMVKDPHSGKKWND